MGKNFVTFLSPGIFVAEAITWPIEAWDIKEAVKMSKSITEWFGAVPYGFFFTTSERTDEELDSREIRRSPMYYLGRSGGLKWPFWL
jgi:hypothetical protein